MTLRWTDWEEDPCAADGTPPYIDWLRTVTFRDADERDGLSLAPLPLSPIASWICGQTHRRAPLPGFARPGSGDVVSDDPLIELSWMPDQDCAVVGVIDSAIALSHAQFRRIDGGTRFLSAWLMNGTWRSGAAVPFGRELFRTELDRLMFKAMAAGGLDEGQFDRASEASQYPHPRGDRRLDTHATHGTSVADLAAGFDLRLSSEDEKRRRLPLIAVGLPPRTSMGSSGNFLEFFAMHAIEYVIDRADRIWRACGHGKDGGFPIVINLSYGLQAGPKDGHLAIEKLIRAVDRAAAEKGRPVRIMLPAGNDLQSEGAAVFELSPGRTARLDWRIRPEDHTPNYAEVWSDVMPGDGGAAPLHPVALTLAPPFGPGGPGARGRHGQRATLIDDARPEVPVARVYCRRHDDDRACDEASWHRVGYILCTGPTLEEDRLHGAPCGDWHIGLGADEAGARAFAYVQSDQSLTFGSDTGLVSSFGHPDFTSVDEAGRGIDVADYPLDGGTPQDTDTTPPMRRRDTLNTIASLREARVIGSYRATDGKPSGFSSAASPDPLGDGRAAPTALLPGADGAARWGVLSAGSKSGSATAMQGTSFSTALATRRVALAMLDWLDDGRAGEAPGSETWFGTAARADEAKARWPGRTVAEKAGFGRLAAPASGRMER